MSDDPPTHPEGLRRSGGQDRVRVSPMYVTEDKVVMFADLLGFAALTEANVLDLKSLKVLDRLFSLDIDDLLEATRNPLATTFNAFHHSLKAALDLAQMRHPLTAITFSDSAFIATAHLFEATNLAIRLLQALLTQKIPVRIGVAYGSFAAIRFRSDITQDSGDHAAHFLGTAVVRSHSAEACGIKGMRILLHPSAVTLLADPAHNPKGSGMESLRIAECSVPESNNRSEVSCEVDYWGFRPTAEAKAWKAFQEMWSAAPETALEHYQPTAAAIDRMRVGQGEAPLKNLRRRTLPRRSASGA